MYTCVFEYYCISLVLYISPHLRYITESFLCLVLRWRMTQGGVCTRRVIHKPVIWTTIAETISVSLSSFYYTTHSASHLYTIFFSSAKLYYYIFALDLYIDKIGRCTYIYISSSWSSFTTFSYAYTCMYLIRNINLISWL